MLVDSSADPAPSESGRSKPGLTVAVLEAGSGLAGLLATAGAEVRPAAEIDQLVELVKAGGVEAVVVDPELPEGWPVDIAERAVEQFGERVPVAVVCRSRRDADMIGHRLVGRGAAVLTRDGLSSVRLAAILTGEVARRSVGPAP